MQIPTSQLQLAEELKLLNIFATKTSTSAAILSADFLAALCRMCAGQLATVIPSFTFLRFWNTDECFP
jgi:hypothetical protein